VADNKSIQHYGCLFVVDSEVDVITNVLPKEDIDKDRLQRHP